MGCSTGDTWNSTADISTSTVIKGLLSLHKTSGGFSAISLEKPDCLCSEGSRFSTWGLSGAPQQSVLFIRKKEHNSARGETKPQNSQQHSNVTHIKHLWALILARVQRSSQYTSFPIINSQAAKVINSYIIIWTGISQIVLHKKCAQLNHSLCQKITV